MQKVCEVFIHPLDFRSIPDKVCLCCLSAEPDLIDVCKQCNIFPACVYSITIMLPPKPRHTSTIALYCVKVYIDGLASG